ncbi:MAG: alpha/beta hydrolase [Deltaproteobacteria bacterium]|nr:alpha/beta hydrolase [Deltaproteobacteria bacterium]
MNIHTELCTFKTADYERLHGLLFTPPDEQSDLVLVMVHGVAMNFYLPPLATFGQTLPQRGHHCFVINTRGHDWISRAGNLTKFGGAAYETFEESSMDLDGALDFMARRGYRRFILVGHSLGCVKSLLYQGTRQRTDIVGVISCSCPKQFYSARAGEQPEFIELMKSAEALIEKGRGDEFIWAPASGALGLFTARTYENKYGRHEKNDVRPHAGSLGCPHLTIAGGAEHPYFPQYARELADAGGNSASHKIVPDSNHFYTNHEVEVVEVIAQWLQQFSK